MDATSKVPKKPSDFEAILRDQGIPYLCGTDKAGVSVQFGRFTMVSSPDDFVFADNGMSEMADATYEVVPWNQTDATKPAKISTKTAKQFTITGEGGAVPAIGDVVTLIIFGKLKGQLG